MHVQHARSAESPSLLSLLSFEACPKAFVQNSLVPAFVTCMGCGSTPCCHNICVFSALGVFDGSQLHACIQLCHLDLWDLYKSMHSECWSKPPQMTVMITHTGCATKPSAAAKEHRTEMPAIQPRDCFFCLLYARMRWSCT